MVKGKIRQPTTGPPNARKGVGKNSSIPSSSISSPALGTQKSCKSQSVPACCGCGVVVSDEVKALQCDRCSSTEIWKCADCLHLSGELYDQLVSDPNGSLKWLCNKCEQIVMDKNYNATAHQNDRMDHLLAVIEKMMDRYEAIERKLESKYDASEAKQLNMRIQHLEEKLKRHDDELECRLSGLEGQLKSSVTPVDVGKDNVITDEEMLKVVIQEELNKKSEEEREVESRKRNIIIYRVPEKKTDMVTERKNNDTVFVKDLLDGVFNMKVEDQDIEKIYRLGRWTEDTSRPLLVAFKNLQHKEHIMENLRNLKQPIVKFRGISIAHDLHPKEREEIKRLVDEAKQDHVDNCDEDVGNFKFLVVGKGPKRKVIKIKKNSSAASI